jgi:putative glutamine amidotransferase
MAAPLIGITSSFAPTPESKFGTISLGESYVQAVIQAGGLPVILPVGLSAEGQQEMLSRLDGLLLTGGADIDPLHFGGQPHPTVYGIDARRDQLEIQAARWAAAEGVPFLGICRGIQVINVALGGTLHTHIPDQLADALRHDWFPDIPRNYLAHAVNVEAGSRLERILGGQAFEVNSLHHQGIERVAPGLLVAAYAPDRLVEAVEVPGHPFGIGVQWHPEWIQEHAPQARLFQTFIDAART